MKVKAFHHVAVRVADIERSTHFYESVFDGRVLWQEEYAPGATPDAPDARRRVRVIQFPGGSAIELVEFTPSEPFAPVVRAAARVLHTCVWVEDVAEAVRRVKANGGAAPGEIVPWQGHNVAMVEDPDGHVIELVDIDLQTATQVMSTGATNWKGIRIELVGQAFSG